RFCLCAPPGGATRAARVRWQRPAEVARLYTDGAFLQRLREQFDGDFTLRFHLAPPLLARRNDNDFLQIQKRSLV
ncbi:TPA: DUF6537 domain-containing protein, partial [Legionella pneumophila]